MDDYCDYTSSASILLMCVLIPFFPIVLPESTAGAPSYVNIVVGSVTGVTVYLLTIILIGIVIHFAVKG